MIGLIISLVKLNQACKEVNMARYAVEEKKTEYLLYIAETSRKDSIVITDVTTDSVYTVITTKEGMEEFIYLHDGILTHELHVNY